MKKTFLYVLLACIFVLSGCGNSKTSSADKAAEDTETAKKKLFYSYENYVKCPVKSVEERTYMASSKFGEVVKGELVYGYYDVWEFNNLGHVEKFVSYNDEGEINWMHKYTYASNGTLSEIAEYSHDGQLYQLYQFECREDGEWLKCDVFDENGDLKRVQVRKLDGDKGVEYRDEKYNDRDTLIEEEIYQYNGDVLETVSFYRNKELYAIQKFSKYDRYGIQEGSIYDASGDMYKSFYVECDKNGNLAVERIFDADGNKTNDRHVKRNENDMVIYERRVEKEEETIAEYEYEYDQKGNWIKRIEYEGVLRKPVKITEREIVYW